MIQYAVTFLAVIGLGLGIWINENCSRGYLPTETEVHWCMQTVAFA